MRDMELSLLRRKLSLLSYPEHFDDTSADLVQRLVDDLIHTTDSYRVVKVQLDARGEDLRECLEKLDKTSGENSRLRSECAKLDNRRLQSDEGVGSTEVQHEDERNEWQERLKELAAQSELVAGQLEALETEHESLKKRHQDLLCGDLELGKDSLLDPGSEIGSNSTAEVCNLPKLLAAAQDRVRMLKAELLESNKGRLAMSEELGKLKESVSSRDAEIHRLTATLDGSPPEEIAALRIRSEMNEEVILDLSKQVDMWKTKLRESEQAAREARQVQAEAAQTKQSRKELERKLASCEREVLGLREQSDSLRAKLMAAQVAKIACSSRSSEICLAEVLESRELLENTENGRSALKQLIGRAHKERSASVSRESGLRAEVKQLKQQLAELKAAKEQLLIKYAAKENRAPSRAVKPDASAEQCAEMCELKEQLQATNQRLREAERQIEAQHERLPRATVVQDKPDRSSAQSLAEQQPQVNEEGFRRSVTSGASDRPADDGSGSLRLLLESAEARNIHLQEELRSSSARCRQASQTLRQLVDGFGAAEGGREARDGIEHIAQILSVAAEYDSNVPSSGLAQQLVGQHRRLQLLEEDAKGERAQAEAARRAYEGARRREEESNALSKQLGERARRAEGIAEQLNTSLHALRVELKAQENRARRDLGQMDSMRQELDKLRSLTLRGDATVQDLLVQLKAAVRKAEATEERARWLSKELDEGRAAYSQLQEALLNLRMEVDRLAEEKAGAAARLAAAEGQISQLTAEASDKSSRLEELGRYVSGLEGQIVHNEEQLTRKSEELEAAQSRLQASVTECSGLHEEVSAVAEDMAMLVRENQDTAAQAAELLQAKERAESRVAQLESDQQYCQQLQHSQAAQLEQEVQTRKGQDEERLQLQKQILRLEEEVAELRAKVVSSRQEVQELQASHEEVQHRLLCRTADVQRLEQEIDRLLGQLRLGSADGEEMEKERQKLLNRLSAAELVRCEAERQRDKLHRRLATAEEQLAAGESRCSQSAARCQALERKVQLQQEVTRELEDVIQGLRTNQFLNLGTLSSQEGGKRERQKQELEARARDESLGEARAQLVESQEENERIAELVTALEEERAALQHANTELQGQIRRPPACLAYEPGQSAAIDELHRLRAELEREKEQRSQAERDFEELLGTIDELHN